MLIHINESVKFYIVIKYRSTNLYLWIGISYDGRVSEA